MSVERRLLLVRHGETEGQSSIRFHGSNDVRLADEGRRQMRALLPLLDGVRPAAVWCSPLRRARESAGILADGLGIPRGRLRAHDGLREIGFGRFEGMTAAEIERADPEWYRAWRAGGVEGFPDGERRDDFARRVTAAYDELAAATPEGDLLVVAHRGVVRWCLRRALAYAEDAPDTFAVALGSLTVVRGGHLEVLGRLP